MNPPTVDRLGDACHRYGPGRLPGADRRTLGAGYACASTATVAVLAFVLLMVSFLLVNPDSATGFFAFLALGAFPVVVPAAFLSGVAAWRLLPDWLPAFGAVAGLVATVTTYCLLTVALVPILAFGTPALTGLGPVTGPAAGLVGGALVVGAFAFLFTCWITIPVGAAGGYVYERVRTATAED